MAQFSQDEAEASYDRQRVAQPSTRRQNGAPDQLGGSSVFSQQINAMMELTNRVSHMRLRARDSLDLISGERPPETGNEKVSPNPATVEGAWRSLMMEVELLDSQINRLYT